MQTVTTINDVRSAVRSARKKESIIGFVPTMGALHEGHLSLIRKARQQCDFVVVSIFVNPTQFGPTEDFDKYPRPIEADIQKAKAENADLIFNPKPSEMYPRELLTSVSVDGITKTLCGKSRPTFFDGVTLVVSKLFNIVNPDIAYFGQKDAQQAIVIRRMVADLNFPIDICVCPIIREENGLAMSSRNQYLSDSQREQASALRKSLLASAKLIASGEKNSSRLIAAITDIIKTIEPSQIDYVKICDLETLEDVNKIDRPVLIALAVQVGPARLIDNIIINKTGEEINL